VWRAVERAVQRRDFRASPSRLCDWCDHQALCPAFGGTPPPFPDEDEVGRSTGAELPPTRDVPPAAAP
jgi:putative RecB family exonuclease